jgi:hypothetical protein
MYDNVDMINLSDARYIECEYPLRPRAPTSLCMYFNIYIRTSMS